MCAVIACRAGEPQGLAERYAQALKDDRLRDAYALTSESFRSEVGFDAFAKHYAASADRTRKADELLSAQQWHLHGSSGEFIAVADRSGWSVVEPQLLEGRPRRTLEAFLGAVDRGDFAAAYAQLTGTWRALYTPERFAEDFAAEPNAKERLARARAAMNQPVRWIAGGAEFPIGDGRAVRLLREGADYKLAAIE